MHILWEKDAYSMEGMHNIWERDSYYMGEGCIF